MESINMEKTMTGYRTWVGPARRYDLIAAMQFNVLTSLGLREHHKVLDIGCGSLRLGRLLIPYLNPEHYHGIEPERWAVAEGFRNELGCDIIKVKRPRFSDEREFNLGVFGCAFDFIMAQSIFSHTPVAWMRTCLNNAPAVMGPGSVFIFNYKLSEDGTNYTGAEWHYPRTIRYTKELVDSLIEEAGLKAIQFYVPGAPAIQIWMRAWRANDD